MSSVLTGGNLPKIRWYDKPIVNVANINNVDHVITGSTYKRALYRVNGIQPELLYQSPFISDSYSDRFNLSPDQTNAIETISNLIIIPSPYALYTFGHINPGTPDSMVRQFSIK